MTEDEAYDVHVTIITHIYGFIGKYKIQVYRSNANDCFSRTLRVMLVGNTTLHDIELLKIWKSHRQIYTVTVGLDTATEQEEQAR
jgi:hypothetical protein